MPTVITRLRRTLEGAFPRGSTKVGVGLVVLGVTSYGFTIIGGRVLGPELLAPLSALWAAVFTIGPGLFLPIEQEVARSLSSRASRGLGGLPVVRRAAMIGALAAGGLLLLVVVTSPLLARSLFAGEAVLVVALAIGIVGSPSVHLVRGVLSGGQDFGRYGLVLGSEGVIRLGGAVVLALVGIREVGPYGVALGMAPLAASLIGLASRSDRLDDGPRVGWSELSRAMGWLLGASAFAQLLVNGAPLVAMLLASEQEAAEVGSLFTGLVIARIPVFLFVAVQAALLPDLAASATAGDMDAFRASVRALFRVATVIGIVAVVLGTTFGPSVIRLLFGPAFVLRELDLGLLTGASVVYVLGLIGAQSLIALERHSSAALSWGAGLVAFGLGSMLPVPGLALRVETAFLLGAATSLIAFAWRLRRFLRIRTTSEHV